MESAFSAKVPGVMTARKGLPFLFICACLLLIWRAPDALFTPQFWAEDGAIFFQQQFGHKLPLLFTTYAGYLHFTPRLIAWLATALNYQYVPLFYNGMALIIEAASIAYFAHRSAFLASHWIILIAFALTPTNGEEFGTITNIQWFLQFSLFAICFYPPVVPPSRSAGWQVLRSALLLTAALTGPFSIFCSALALAVFAASHLLSTMAPQSRLAGLTSAWWRSVDKIDVAVVTVGSIIQIFALLFLGVRQNKGKPSIAMGEMLLSHGLQEHILGTQVLPSVLFVALVTILIASLVFLAYNRHSSHLLIALGLIAFGLMQVISISYVGVDVIASPNTMNGDRYYFFFKIALWLSIAASSCALPLKKPRRLQLLVAFAIAVIAVFTPQVITRKPLNNLHWKQEAARIGSERYPIEIPINPSPWKIYLTLPRQPDSTP